jgi:hypothetical protein
MPEQTRQRTWLGACWRWLTTSRHTRWLEEEVERLRADRDEARRQLWALLNSLVTISGAPLPQEILRQATARASQPQTHTHRRGRRSWHQQATRLEIESARDAAPGTQEHDAAVAKAESE